MSSISRRFLIAIGVASISITLLTTAAAVAVAKSDLARGQQRRMGEYTAERVANLSRRFHAIADVQREAGDALRLRLAAATPTALDRLYEARFPLAPDGTRRSRPQDFDGRFEPGGQYVHGMGAFLSPRPSSPQERAVLAAAFDVVLHFGEGVHSIYDNVYFVTPTNKVVIFGPDRPDRLHFLRAAAPATMDFSGEEMMALVSPRADPDGRTRCTSLQPRLQNFHRGARTATACLTPVYLQGRYVGAFGSSIELAGFLADAVREGSKGSTSLLVRSEGDLLAAPALLGGLRPGSAAAAAEITNDFALKPLMARVKAAGAAQGLVESPDGRRIVAFGRMERPDWYLLVTYPRWALRTAALKQALWILGLGVAASLLQAALVVGLARRYIVSPLRVLATSCLPEAPPDPQSRALEGRADEIGVLARALCAERGASQLVQASLEERVLERTAELERADQEKSRFLANMSHELRTPLNGVIAVSEKLLERQSDAQGRELAELIVNSGRLLERVLGDVLDLSGLETGEVVLVEEPVSLKAVVERVCRLHQAVALAKGLDLTWWAAADCDGRFMGDAVRISQVLSNLIGNAVKFTEVGWADVRLEHAGERGVRFTVTDTGVGLDDDEVERLLPRADAADPAQRRRLGSATRGLVVCRILVDAMGGAIEGRSRPGVGSAFSFTLPLAPADVRPVEAHDPNAPAPSPLAGARVLLAEDHPTNQKVVSLILGAVGAVLTVVDDGQVALEALEAGAFDLVLMDVQMPVMDGLTAVRLIREGERARRAARMPIAMLTANALSGHADESLRAGADRHISKPIRAEELIEVVADLLEGAGTAADRRATV